MKLKRILPSVIAFMLLFPFRLPISVLLIMMFNSIANLAGKIPSDDIMCSNVIITKLVYNLIFGSWFIYCIERMSRKLMKRKAHDHDKNESIRVYYSMYWWTGLILCLVTCYVIYDCFASYQLFYGVIGKEVPQ